MMENASQSFVGCVGGAEVDAICILEIAYADQAVLGGPIHLVAGLARVGVELGDVVWSEGGRLRRWARTGAIF